MYEIYARYYIVNPVSDQKEAKDICIYNDKIQSDSLKVVDPKLVLTDSAAGSLDITLPPTNIGYDVIERMTSDITVKKDGVDIWFGRVLSESVDLWKNRVLTCEGALAFLNDTIQPQIEYKGVTIRGFLESMLTEHNNNVSENRKIYVGQITINDWQNPHDLYTNYETTLYSLNLLKENLGGHIRLMKRERIIDQETKYVWELDYMNDSPIDTHRQTISFGRNLVDFTKSFDMDEFATVLLPLGAKLTTNEIEGIDAYLTVKDADIGQGRKYGSVYVENSEAVSNFGWIAKRVNFDDVTDPNILLEKATEYLSSIQFENMVLEVNAFDLHYLNDNIEAIALLDNVHVISTPHGLNSWFIVTELEIPLDSPEKTQFKMGSNVKNSLTETNSKTSSEIYDRITSNGHSLLKEARENADLLISNATSGYITIVRNSDVDKTDALYISNDRDYKNSSKYWVWNMNGLAYYDKNWADNPGSYPSSYPGARLDPETGKPLPIVGMTIDGAIVANFITAGVLNADVIRAGVIRDIPDDDSKLNVNFADVTVLYDKESGADRKRESATIRFYNTYYRSGSPIYSIDIPEELLDYVVVGDAYRSEYIPNFIWSDEYYPGSTDPELDGESVFVLEIDKHGEDPSFNFFNLEFIKIFEWDKVKNNYPGIDNPHLEEKQVFVLTAKGPDEVVSSIYTFTEDDYYGSNLIFDLDNGNLVMKKGHIKLGAYDKNSEHYKFEVDSDGNVYAGSGVFAGSLAAAKGTFEGTLVAVDGTFDGIVRASDFRDKQGQSLLMKLTNDNASINSTVINLGNRIILDGNAGTINMVGNSSGSGTPPGRISLNSDTGTIELTGNIFLKPSDTNKSIKIYSPDISNYLWITDDGISYNEVTDNVAISKKIWSLETSGSNNTVKFSSPYYNYPITIHSNGGIYFGGSKLVLDDTMYGTADPTTKLNPTEGQIYFQIPQSSQA